MPSLSLGVLKLKLGTKGALFKLTGGLRAPALPVGVPEFEIAGKARGDFVYKSHARLRALPRGGQAWVIRYGTKGEPVLKLDVEVRGYPDSPFLRFRYTLTADAPVHLTRKDGRDAIRYLDTAPSPKTALTEIQLSHFDPVVHSYLPSTRVWRYEDRYDGQRFAGPVLILEHGRGVSLLAYEHGADHPLSFLEFTLEDACSLSLSARQGNCHDGQVISKEKPFQSVWFELGTHAGNMGELLRRYRQFFLNEVAENVESRKPYLYYNTWNHQERNKYFRGRPYLESMTQDRILAEIDVAHEIGLDVFVLDTGWYVKTGDWVPNELRFPGGLQHVRRKLEGYGMKLGLWFNPVVAAKTSKIYREHPEYVMSRDGKPAYWGPIWETEESYGMCLASGYAEHFVQTMARLHKELGVSYYKWDAIGQYGCDAPNHDHGTEANSAAERSECYAYESGRAMIRIVEEVTRQCPDVIVDFDVTEGGRFVGLGFLSVGKYFLCNNGPYFHDFDIPRETKIVPDTINALFYPGPARSRLCRQQTRYDPIIPSILFLTHYFPDAPVLSQMNSFCALMLGGNGIWGDLLALSTEDRRLLRSHLLDYKRAGAAVTRAYPRVTGFAGSSPEIHEKLDPKTGSGAVVFFSVAPGRIAHVTQRLSARPKEVKGADEWEWQDGRVKLTVNLERNGARPVYFFGRDAR